MANAPTRRSTRFSMRSKQLGQLLLDDEVIQAEHIAKALKIQEKKGGLVGQILREMGCCDDAAIAAALLKQVQVTDVHCEDLAVEPPVIATVSREQCETDKLCPFEVLGSLLCVVMGNPLNRKAINALEDASRLKVKPFKAPWAKIHELIERTYTDENVAAAGEAAEVPSLDLPEELPALDLDEAAAPTEIRLPEVIVPEAEPEPEPEPELAIEGLDELDETQAELIETDNRGLSQRNRKPRILDESQAKNLPKKEAKVNVDLDTLDLSEASEVVGTPDAGGHEEEEELEEISAAAAPASGHRAIEPYTLAEVGDDFFFTPDAVPTEGTELPPAFFELIAQLPEAEVVAESLEAWEADKASQVQAAVKATGKRAAADLPLELQPAPAGTMVAVEISEAEFQTLSAGCDTDPLGEWDWQYAAGGPVEAVEYEAESV